MITLAGSGAFKQIHSTGSIVLYHAPPRWSECICDPGGHVDLGGLSVSSSIVDLSDLSVSVTLVVMLISVV